MFHRFILFFLKPSKSLWESSSNYFSPSGYSLPVISPHLKRTCHAIHKMDIKQFTKWIPLERGEQWSEPCGNTARDRKVGSGESSFCCQELLSKGPKLDHYRPRGQTSAAVKGRWLQETRSCWFGKVGRIWGSTAPHNSTSVPYNPAVWSLISLISSNTVPLWTATCGPLDSLYRSRAWRYLES